MDCRNVGYTDQIVRVLIALALILIGVSYAQAYFVWMAVLAILLVFTVLFQWCPVYALLNINTCEKSVEEKVVEARRKAVVGQSTKSKKVKKAKPKGKAKRGKKRSKRTKSKR